MTYGITRENTTYLHGQDAAFYQKWLHDSMAGYFAESSKGRRAFKGVESIIEGPPARGMEITTTEGLSYIVGVMTAAEKTEFQKGLVGEVEAIIATDKTNKRLQLGSLFFLVEAAYLTGTRGIVPLLARLKTGFDLTQKEHKQIDDLVRDAHAGLDVRTPQAGQPILTP